jgi:hypothetical protein
MLPGQTEKFVSEAEDAVEEDLDPNPCWEDEEFFKLRPDGEEMARTGRYIPVHTSTLQYIPVYQQYILVLMGTY